MKSRKRARKIVTAFHKLTTEAEKVASSAAPDRTDRLEQLNQEIKQLGGRDAYQSASILSVSFHNTSKWVTQQLTEMGLRPGRRDSPLKVLEVRTE